HERGELAGALRLAAKRLPPHLGGIRRGQLRVARERLAERRGLVEAAKQAEPAQPFEQCPPRMARRQPELAGAREPRERTLDLSEAQRADRRREHGEPRPFRRLGLAGERREVLLPGGAEVVAAPPRDLARDGEDLVVEERALRAPGLDAAHAKQRER